MVSTSFTFVLLYYFSSIHHTSRLPRPLQIKAKKRASTSTLTGKTRFHLLQTEKYHPRCGQIRQKTAHTPHSTQNACLRLPEPTQSYQKIIPPYCSKPFP